MRWIAVLLAMAAMLCGCRYETTTASEEMEEPARVASMGYTPPSHGSGTGVGMSMSGEAVVTSVDVSTAPRWIVMFECAHGRFVVDRDNPRLFEKLREGQEVTVSYRELYRDEMDGKERVGRSLAGYDFLDATVRR